MRCSARLASERWCSALPAGAAPVISPRFDTPDLRTLLRRPVFTRVWRLLGANVGPARLGVIVLGGAAFLALLAEARRHGVLISTYRMSETWGGCDRCFGPCSVVRRAGPKVPRLRDRRPCPARPALW